MSFSAMAWASKCVTGSSSRKLVLLLLADRANDKGQCFPSLETIASDCEISKRTVIRNIKELEANGFLSVNRRATETAHISNTYTLNVGVVDGRGSVTVSPQEKPTELPPQGTEKGGVTDDGGGDTMSPEGCHHVTSGVTPCHPNLSCNLSSNPLEEDGDGGLASQKCETATSDDCPPDSALAMLRERNPRASTLDLAADLIIKLATERGHGFKRMPAFKIKEQLKPILITKSIAPHDLIDGIMYFYSEANLSKGRYAVKIMNLKQLTEDKFIQLLSHADEYKRDTAPPEEVKDGKVVIQGGGKRI